MPDKQVVVVDAVKHHYQRGLERFPVLDGVSLEVAPSETVALIGRSGSGKSTLLNLIGGLEPIQAGEIKLLGQAIASLNDSQRTKLRRQHIGFIYQSFNLVPTLNVAENISLPLALAGVPSKLVKAKVHKLLELVSLEGRASDYPDVLSGGEQQRVAIARALIHEPAILLADEPTGNLDAQSGRQIIALLQSMVSQNKAAMLLVTHSLEVASMADRALAIEQAGLRNLSDAQLQGHVAW